MIKNNLLTIILSVIIGIVMCFIGRLDMWIIALFAITFVYFIIFRGKQFWLIIVSYVINIFLFLQNYSYSHGVTIMPLGPSFIYSLMGFSALLVLIYGLVNFFSWKSER